ncbi:nuclear transport factor 2 family protein [Streptomyces sp. NPDC101152]|uniref:nuclear transport factor 2 family protein n=1 Tax=Streptomyces sp. NPDC101152 TaxID=3366116 RepID=UPI0037FB94DA
MSTQENDTEAVTQLVLRERQSRDRGWYDDMASCFAPDAIIEMSWFTGPASEFIARTRQRSTAGVWGRHRLSPPTVRVHGDRAWAELPLGIEFRIDVDGVEADLISYCRSQYRARRYGDVWKLVKITSIYERDTLTAAVPGHQLGINPNALLGYRTSYRCLAWYFEQIGTPLSHERLGDDRPEDTALHYRSEQAWLARVGDSCPRKTRSPCTAAASIAVDRMSDDEVEVALYGDQAAAGGLTAA